MLEKQVRIKITRQYQHPRTNAIIVHFEFDIGTRGNMNFPASMFIGLTEKQIEEEIWRSLENHYAQKQRELNPDLQKKLKRVTSRMDKKERK